MEKIKSLYQRHGDILRYLIIGGLTTLIDILIFGLMHSILGIHYQVSKVITWVFAVAFAFWGNKVVVFRSRTAGKKALAREAASFVSMRLLTLVFSLLFMFVCVEWLGLDEFIANILCNIFVVILNYILSKLVVFRRKR